MGLSLSVRIERFPLAPKAVSPGVHEKAVAVAELSDGSHRGRGECAAHPRYGKTIDEVAAVICGMAQAIAGGLDRDGLQSAMPAGAARNAIDCAFWDLEAKQRKLPCHVLAGLPKPVPLTTAYTISRGAPQEMAAAAAAAKAWPLLKIKLGGRGDPERLAAVRRAAPDAELIADANGSWDASNLGENLAACERAGIRLLEQPFAPGSDDILIDLPHHILLCADESALDCSSLVGLTRKYDAVNLKLDKTGGLTEAIKMARQAKQAGFALMVGCTVGTSLAMAPAHLLAQLTGNVDLDGPLSLAADRPDGLHYENGIVQPPDPALWG
jgi:L-alanine-DL-glutamate epimerase-like enolase superfamily enzyme